MAFVISDFTGERFMLNPKNFTVLALSLYALSGATAEEQQVYQAQAGAAPQQEVPSPQDQEKKQPQATEINPQQAKESLDSSETTPPTPVSTEKNEENTYIQTSSPKYNQEVIVKEHHKVGEKLSKMQQLSQDKLKKAVIFFFGVWCVACEALLKKFAATIDFLRLYGVNVVFVAIPQPDSMKNWKEPTMDDYKAAETKLASYGIDLSYKKIQLVMLGDKVTLAKNGIEGLPVVIVVKNGKESFRTYGDQAVKAFNLSEDANLKGLLGVWDSESKVKKAAKKEAEQPIKAKAVVAKIDKKAAKKGKAKTMLNKRAKVRTQRSRDLAAYEATRLLNKFDPSRYGVTGVLFGHNFAK